MGVGPHGENGGAAAGAVEAASGIKKHACLYLTLLCTCRYGSWSSWGGWGRCSRSCCGGTRDMKRECLYFNPVMYCTCRYGSWPSCGGWVCCSRSCGGGNRDRNHACLFFNPVMHMQVRELVLMGRMGALQLELWRRDQG